MLSPFTLNQTTLNDPWTIFQLLTKKNETRERQKRKGDKIEFKNEYL